MKPKKILMLILAIAAGMGTTNAQMRIGGTETPNHSAILDLNPDNNVLEGNATLGLALPRVKLRNSNDAYPLSSHVKGITVYNMATVGDVKPGMYTNDGTKWLRQMDSDSPVLAIEQDGVVGNEVVGATDGSLTRSGSGTKEVPYTLAVSENGITTKHINNQSITMKKLSQEIIDQMMNDNFVFDYHNPVLKERIVSLIREYKQDSIVGNEVVGATDNSLTRSGNGTEKAPYTLAVSENGITAKHLKNQSVTMDKLSHEIINQLGNDNIVFDYNNPTLKERIVSLILENDKDGVIGNEVVDAIQGEGLIRSGTGTAESPYRLGIAKGGVTTDKIADKSVTFGKLSETTILELKELIAGVNNQELKNWIVNLIFEHDKDNIAGNEVVGATDNSLTRSGSGTEKAPYTLAVSENGITTQHLKNQSVTMGKLSNEVIEEIMKERFVFDYNNPTLKEKIVSLILENDKDGVIGNEVVGATDASLTRSGSGTEKAPYTLAVSPNGITTQHIKNQTVTAEKLSEDLLKEVRATPAIRPEDLKSGTPNSIIVSDANGQWKTQKLPGNSAVFNYGPWSSRNSGWFDLGHSLQAIPAGLYVVQIDINCGTTVQPVDYIVLDVGAESIYTFARKSSEAFKKVAYVESCLIFLTQLSTIRLLVHTPVVAPGTATVTVRPLIQLQ